MLLDDHPIFAGVNLSIVFVGRTTDQRPFRGIALRVDRQERFGIILRDIAENLRTKVKDCAFTRRDESATCVPRLHIRDHSSRERAFHRHRCERLQREARKDQFTRFPELAPDADHEGNSIKTASEPRKLTVTVVARSVGWLPENVL